MNFVDGHRRVFIPYKGYMIVLKDGTMVKDPLTKTDEGPFEIVIDTLSHGNWHNLYNLIDNTGMNILPKGVRKITYYSVGYYLAEDNNEDELINRGDVKGGFRLNNFRQTFWIIDDNGNVYFDNEENKELFSSIRKLSNLTFVGRFLVDRFVIKDGIIIDDSSDPNESEYSSAMWADYGIWGMNVVNKDGHKHYFFGEGNEVINYVHEVLISHRGTIFLEKNGVWYLRWLSGRMKECFYDL
ncbi:MAG: hypothetical protein ACI392_03775 [Paludibacteraceae bacterium]